ncbi:MAG: phage N-6-adenine-methyltransferase [Brasilonema angustatum HA4187-MV1]|jgi:phage N-6-adenine-methyltransferase|nr:phage N-6-adenine-methyltransferase [Brasilonema angustatum HA4187-MV1]
MPRSKIYRSNAEKQRAYRRRKKGVAVILRSTKEEWETPQEIFDPLNEEFNFELDLAALPHNAKCSAFYTPVIDALKQEWQGVCWLNPPYGSQLRHWIKKAYESANKGATIVCLLPARSCTTWWHDYVLPYAEIRYLRGRLKFSGATNSATFPSAIVIFRPASTV